MSEFMEQKAGNREVPVYHTYKDRVFRLLFKEKGRLLELYNSLNGTNYSDFDDFTITTLENAIFMKMKNDLSFIIDSSMCLYEHQSTDCPNMPLRGLLYLTDLYKKQLKEADLCTSKLIRISTPHYIVFYNGVKKKEEEFNLKLSDAFEDDKKGCLELTVRVININIGYNRKLFEKCSSLYGYAYFVAAIRKNLKEMTLRQAVETAVEECIRKNILKDFFLEQKAEVIAMSIYEYNEEYVKRTVFEDGRDQGLKEGLEKGKKAGLKEGEAFRMVKSVETLMKNFNIDLNAACNGIGVTLEEYARAKSRSR